MEVCGDAALTATGREAFASSGGFCQFERLLPARKAFANQGNQLPVILRSPDVAVERDRLSVGAGDLEGGIAGGRDTEGHLLNILVVLWFYQHIPSAFGARGGSVGEVLRGELDASLSGIDRRRVGSSVIGQVADDQALCYLQIIIRCKLPDASAHG